MFYTKYLILRAEKLSIRGEGYGLAESLDKRSEVPSVCNQRRWQLGNNWFSLQHEWPPVPSQVNHQFELQWPVIPSLLRHSRHTGSAAANTYHGDDGFFLIKSEPRRVLTA